RFDNNASKATNTNIGSSKAVNQPSIGGYRIVKPVKEERRGRCGYAERWTHQAPAAAAAPAPGGAGAGARDFAELPQPDRAQSPQGHGAAAVRHRGPVGGGTRRTGGGGRGPAGRRPDGSLRRRPVRR